MTGQKKARSFFRAITVNPRTSNGSVCVCVCVCVCEGGGGGGGEACFVSPRRFQ